MVEDRSKRAQRLFDAAMDMPADRRRIWLEAEGADDPGLLAEVLRLVAHGEVSTRSLEMPSIPEGAKGPVLPTGFGRYKLLEILGEGGMGVVYLAQRESDGGGPGLVVALKVLGSEFPTREDRQRFEHERKLLSALEHPNIARLLDSGTTEDGQAYFVMEYIRGLAIDRYCDQHELRTEERLLLFQKVCDAVHYVHTNLIIHRDIKPGNVLVTPEGEPKLLDFGISKLVNPALGPSMQVTLRGSRPLTPRYASPEQVRQQPLTTATDVYSLGVMLYELLTGRWPFPHVPQNLREIEQAICEAGPEKPSNAVLREESGESATAAGTARWEHVARARGSEPAKLRGRLRGDVDNILLKALEKSPRRRYASAAEFAEDIGRHLRNQTVIAMPPSLSDRVSKFARRNPVLLSALAVVLVILSGSVLGVSEGWRRANRARAAAEASEARAAQSEAIARREADAADVARRDMAKLASSLVGELHERVTKLPGSGPIRLELANLAVETLEPLLNASPDDKALQLFLAESLGKIGESLHDRRSPSVGDFQGAMRVHRRANLILREQAAADPQDLDVQRSLGESELRIADLHRSSNAIADAAKGYDAAIAIFEKLVEPSSPRQGLRTRLAAALAGQAKCAESRGDKDAMTTLIERAQRVREEEMAEFPSDETQRNVAGGYLDLAQLRAANGMPEAALDLADKAVAIRRELARKRPEEARARRDLAGALKLAFGVYFNAGREQTAKQLITEAAGIASALLESERSASSDGKESADPRTRHAFVETHLLVSQTSGPAALDPSSLDRLQRAVDEARRLASDVPEDVEYRRLFVKALLEIGRRRSGVGQHSQALNDLAEADQQATQILGQRGEVGKDRLLQARVRWARGDAEASAGRDLNWPEDDRAGAFARAREQYESSLSSFRSAPDGEERDRGLAEVHAAIQALGL